MRLHDVDTGKLSGLKNELVYHFELVEHMVRDDMREFVNDMDRQRFLERDLIGFGMCGY